MASFDNVLYIIGNGFDLHHGVTSSYGAFEAWLKGKNKKLYRKLNDVCRVDYLWSDFEKALADVDRDYFLTLGDMWMPDMWTEDDSYAELYYAQDTVREEAENLWGDIQKWFRKWVNIISWKEEYDAKKVWLDYEARFITFNYTPFLETQYGIPTENILYVHGKQGDGKNLPIIGHDGRDTFDDWYKKNRYYKRYYKGKRSNLPEVEMMTYSVEEYFSLSEKPVMKILCEHQAFIDDIYDVEHIYVLGHSLGNVDIPYFKAISAANDYPEKLHWYVSYYSDDEKKRLEKTIRNRIIDRNASLEMMTLASIQRYSEVIDGIK